MSDDYHMRADDNAVKIQNEIEYLSQGSWRIPLIERNYASYWAHAKKVVQLFKELKPLRRDDRENLWARYQEECNETKREQENEHQERLVKSERHKRYILSEVSSARVNTLFGFDPPDIEEMKHLSGVLKEARRMLSNNKGEMIADDKKECYEDIRDVQIEHDAWWEELKVHKREKHREFQARVRLNLERNRERLRKARDALNSCERSADDLRSKIASAYNDNWASDAEGWLSELEDKIRDIEDSIRSIEDWIEEDEAKLK